jgi:hypothetical protein
MPNNIFRHEHILEIQMKNLETIVQKITFNIMKEPGTKLEILQDFANGIMKKGNIVTVKNTNFPWIRIEEYNDGWLPCNFRKIEK